MGSTDPVLATLSQPAVDALINPALNPEYTSVVRGALVNVTSARCGKAPADDDTGAFDLTTGACTGLMPKLTGIGMVPAPVVSCARAAPVRPLAE